jgi:hypothetical protein
MWWTVILVKVIGHEQCASKSSSGKEVGLITNIMSNEDWIFRTRLWRDLVHLKRFVLLEINDTK